MEEKLNNLVQRITASSQPDEVKAELFDTISRGMHALVWPVLLKYIPTERLKGYAEHPETITVDSYIDLISEASGVQDGQAMKDLEQVVNTVLDDVGKVLTKYHIE
ncbi:hypothetical protein A2Z33_03530 [Candidatus Gottesmanbacteria bacterium RBG_16_52_11]|uniref:Uncharacterized protein n=1 Tax=Candidatus Gottesmanbacteria bacterium RBG_16_52_11 TaxID=1798374 RepID=A0A1F5YVF7_9BACT|nr:MAG: hypothetical protein A2Z33_03530 [Candidatus Gottesmanbacteria bacterium RBG_16_52_11]